MAVEGGGVTRAVEAFEASFSRLQRNIEQFMRGKPEVVRSALICFFAGGHLLIDDVPGVGKTSLAKAMALSIGAAATRIQFTPDLLPSDITGVEIYDRHHGTFRFEPGPIFSHIVLADEINRGSPKVQAALLEAMEERQVTNNRTTYPLAPPFIVIATSNPVDHEGVFSLPEAQLDRFLMRIKMGYPELADECAIVDGYLGGRYVNELHAVLSLDDVHSMSSVLSLVEVRPALQEYIAQVVGETRTRPELALGGSPRATIALAAASRCRAAACGRSYATADDVKTLAHQVLAHRLVLQPKAERGGVTVDDLIDRILQTVELPR